MFSPMVVIALKALLLLPFVACLPSWNRRTPSSCLADERERWSYRGLNGPPYWGERYPACYGRKQSPIDISTKDVIRNENIGSLRLNNYDVPISSGRMENNGHTVEITPHDGVERTISVGDDSYTLEQFHFHWGENYHKGAEHIIDGVQYAMEMHLVHRNRQDQIAVVGILFQEQSRDNTELQSLIPSLSKIKYKDQNTKLSRKIDLSKLFPSRPDSFYRYEGSLTTPNCAEGVTWSLLTNIAPVGKSQMSEFRKLYSATRREAMSSCKLVNNYRPTQPLNNRQVYVSQ